MVFFEDGFPAIDATELLETRNRLHLYSRACCTWCGPRYEPLSGAPFIERGINGSTDFCSS
ncbi:hypothetical protein [Malikia spinosa]|uniref:hypothetical protein n=1 Tax=Malikia spinosa TaxID=86180 RepID=UPI0011B09F8C